MEPWARTVICGRARLGGIPVGVVGVETRTVDLEIPADPANINSELRNIQQAGQVWFPDSAYKTAQALKDFNREELPLFIFANWRGFSGGMKDMYEMVSYVLSPFHYFFQLIPFFSLFQLFLHYLPLDFIESGLTEEMIKENARVKEELLEEEEKKKDLLSAADKGDSSQKYKQLEYLLQKSTAYTQYLFGRMKSQQEEVRRKAEKKAKKEAKKREKEKQKNDEEKENSQGRRTTLCDIQLYGKW